MSTSSVSYKGNVVNPALNTMVIFPDQFNNLATEVETTASEVINATGFQQYVNTMSSGTIGGLIENCGACESDLITIIREAQIEILSYSKDGVAINDFVRSLSYDEYHSLDLSKIENYITPETKQIKAMAIPPHSEITDEERARRMKYLMPDGEMSSDEEQERKYISMIEIPIWTGTEMTTKNIRVNSKLAETTKSLYKELADNHVPIKYYDAGGYYEAEGYYYKDVIKYDEAGNEVSRRLSDHGYGSAFDINSEHNPFISGENPDDTEYKVDEKVVQIMAKYGYYWGGDWDDKQDYMHFSWTGW